MKAQDLLTQLSRKYGCDKSDKKHRYTPRYNALFGWMRTSSFNMMEFGFGQGKSVKMWMEYFPKVKLVTVDNRDELPDDKLLQKYIKQGRFEFLSADQIDTKKIDRVAMRYGCFHIIIDDASHVPEDQQFTFGSMFPWVEDGCWYVIEDLKCKRSHSTRFKYQSPRTIPVLKNYIETGTFHSPVLSKKQNLYLNEHIEFIKIYDKIAFIKKRSVDEY